MTPQKPRPVVPSLREAKAAENTSDVDVDQQLLGYLTGCNCLADVPLLDAPLPDVRIPEAHQDGSVGQE